MLFATENVYVNTGLYFHSNVFLFSRNIVAHHPWVRLLQQTYHFKKTVVTVWKTKKQCQGISNGNQDFDEWFITTLDAIWENPFLSCKGVSNWKCKISLIIQINQTQLIFCKYSSVFLNFVSGVYALTEGRLLLLLLLLHYYYHYYLSCWFKHYSIHPREIYTFTVAIKVAH